MNDVLALYDAQMREDPPRAAGVRNERLGSVVRMTGLYNVVQSTRLREEDAAAAVAEQADFAREAGIALEWKVFDHDGPPSLRRLLRAAGFVTDESETFMAFDLRNEALDHGPPVEVEIRRVVDARDVDDYVAVGSAAFGEDRMWQAESYVQSLDDPAVTLFVAYAGGAPVSAGRLQTPEGRAFASKWGGGTSPEHRGRGIYRALVAERAREARKRGFRYLTVDARESSRPILQRLGFVALDGVSGWVLHAEREG